MTGATTFLGIPPSTVETPLGRLRLFTAGAGTPVVLIHGLSGAAATWVDVVDGIRSTHRVVAVDLPGHGGSSLPLRAAGGAWYADAVAAAIESLGLEPAVVAGHSFGGQVAAHLVLRRPDLVRAVLLIGPSGVDVLPARTRVLAVLTTAIRPGARVAPLGVRLADRAWFRRLAFGPLLVSDPVRLSPRVVAGFFAELREHTDVRTARRAVLGDAPILLDGPLSRPGIVLWGSRDRVVPVEHGLALARRTGAQLRVVPDCGHLLIGERPDTVVDAISALSA
jgi:pyruvate dehydrogenase E2 component (dihydrolipoamide acetyltransferase)